MKLYLLFDASAVKHYYLDREEFSETLACLWSLKNTKQAFFFIPSFCITEVRNIFAKHYYRYKLIDKDLYEKITKEFLDAVHNRNIFYSYDLNRYHNINADRIFEKEHTINTEFQAIGKFPKGNTPQEKERSLAEITNELTDRGHKIAKFYLSSYDILIIAMALELRHFFGEKRVYIITKDERLKTICEKGNLSKVFYLPRDTSTKISEIVNSK